MRDVTLEIDDFSRNRIITGATAMAQQLYILLNMDPGDCADDPDKGIGLRQYKVGILEENGPALQEAITRQVSLYCDFETSEVQIGKQNGELVMGITSPSFAEILVFQTNKDTVLASIIDG
jgi:hypothetical protein